MKTMQFLIIATLVAFVAGCAAKAPSELVNARAAYQHASEGPAEKLVPAELHKAHEALDRAEQSFLKEPKSDKTKDLAYVALRKAELAGALGATAADKAKKDKADAEFQKQQAEIVKQGKQDLSDAEKQQAETLAAMAAEQASKDKADAEKRQAETIAAMTAEQANKDKAAAELQKQGKQDLSDSEKRTADALAALANLAAVKEEERGLVITLSGGVLFQSAQSTLMSSAQVKLDQVANALLAVRARNLIVEGHTDSQGSESYNQGLSQRRADAVRDYLVQKGYPADHIQARGKGKGNPIADNASPEGRANNRRVEIVVERESKTPNR
jgi:outer membrane protein OmpA-like peptidoglycan-associated protein